MVFYCFLLYTCSPIIYIISTVYAVLCGFFLRLLCLSVCVCVCANMYGFFVWSAVHINEWLHLCKVTNNRYRLYANKLWKHVTNGSLCFHHKTVIRQQFSWSHSLKARVKRHLPLPQHVQHFIMLIKICVHVTSAIRLNWPIIITHPDPDSKHNTESTVATTSIRCHCIPI